MVKEAGSLPRPAVPPQLEPHLEAVLWPAVLVAASRQRQSSGQAPRSIVSVVLTGDCAPDFSACCVLAASPSEMLHV